jgi:hypothetical protein
MRRKIVLVQDESQNSTVPRKTEEHYKNIRYDSELLYQDLRLVPPE